MREKTFCLWPHRRFLSQYAYDPAVVYEISRQRNPTTTPCDTLVFVRLLACLIAWVLGFSRRCTQAPCRADDDNHNTSNASSGGIQDVIETVPNSGERVTFAPEKFVHQEDLSGHETALLDALRARLVGWLAGWLAGHKESVH